MFLSVIFNIFCHPWTPPDAYHRFSIGRGHRVSIYINLVYLYCVNYLVGLEILKLKMEGFLNGVGGVRGNYACLPTNCLSTGIFHIFKTSYTSPTRRWRKFISSLSGLTLLTQSCDSLNLSTFNNDGSVKVFNKKMEAILSSGADIILLCDIRGAFNQECESIHKIRMNKVI